MFTLISPETLVSTMSSMLLLHIKIIYWLLNTVFFPYLIFTHTVVSLGRSSSYILFCGPNHKRLDILFAFLRFTKSALISKRAMKASTGHGFLGNFITPLPCRIN